jgi:hypothetical protein
MAIETTEERDDMPTPISPSLRVATILVVAAVLTGCGGGAPSTQAPSAAPPATSEASGAAVESATASAIPEATPAPPVVVPSLTADTPLVDILPAELGGEATQKLALVGDDLTSLDGSTAMVFGSLLNFIDAEGADMTIGAASNARASVIAIRIKGKSATEVGDAMIKGRTLNATTTSDELDLGGKHVIKITTTIAPLPFYVYGAQDVSFTIAGADESIVTEALSKLP